MPPTLASNLSPMFLPGLLPCCSGPSSLGWQQARIALLRESEYMVRVRILFVFTLLFAVFGGLLARGASAATLPQVDPRLRSALASATGPVEVVVSFRGDGAPSAK